MDYLVFFMDISMYDHLENEQEHMAFVHRLKMHG